MFVEDDQVTFVVDIYANMNVPQYMGKEFTVHTVRYIIDTHTQVCMKVCAATIILQIMIRPPPYYYFLHCMSTHDLYTHISHSCVIKISAIPPHCVCCACMYVTWLQKCVCSAYGVLSI
jgi:hypothetical protein